MQQHTRTTYSMSSVMSTDFALKLLVLLGHSMGGEEEEEEQEEEEEEEKEEEEEEEEEEQEEEEEEALLLIRERREEEEKKNHPTKLCGRSLNHLWARESPFFPLQSPPPPLIFLRML